MSNQTVWRSLQNNAQTWKPMELLPNMSSHPERIKAQGNMLCIEEATQAVNCAMLGITRSPMWWFPVDEKIEDFSIANGTVVWVSTAGRGVNCFGLPLFPPIYETFTAVATDGEFVCAARYGSHDVVCATRTEATWRAIGVKFAEMSMRGGSVVGITPNGSVLSIKLAIGTEEEAQAVEKAVDPLDPSTIRPFTSTRGFGSGAIVGISVCAACIVVIIATLMWQQCRSSERKLGQRLEPFDRFESPSTSTRALTQASRSQDSVRTDWAKDELLLATRIPLRDLEFERKVSRGAFGDVYKGQYNGQIVAIKVLAESRRRSLLELQNFAQEARFMAVLQHEHIVRFIGVAWNAPSELCIVAEYLGGGDLRTLLYQYLDEGRPEGFTPKKTKIALHVAHALTYLHSLQPIVLHRDLKSKNILLTKTGDAKLTDFGVSRELEDATMTAGVGSSLWMAPEVVQGERYDEKADVYSFGVVLSELDTNELPFAAVQRDGIVLNSQSGSECTGRRRLPEIAILQLVAQGQLSVRFSENADSAIKQIGQDWPFGRCDEASHTVRSLVQNPSVLARDN
ncbi:hypothetical protein PINS_up015750 [Pythium insidiosum]|nr:hypothetical protein PINS_up015750 [Pythium insidiosum]